MDGAVYEVSEDLDLDKNKQHTIEIVVDRLVVQDEIAGRLSDSVQTALKYGDGVVLIDVLEREELLFSEKFACIDCGISMEELTPRMFSFNSLSGGPVPPVKGLAVGRKLIRI